MAKVKRHLKDMQKDFQKIFNGLCYSRSSWQVWSDFINMAAISISNACDKMSDKREEREKYYMQVAKGYSKTELDAMAELLSIVVIALEENPEQDFLGELFMALELGNHWKGQFFTPYHVCQLMAEMQMSDMDEIINKKGWISVNDCACGAGALLIAARNTMMRKKLNWSIVALFVAQDIDRTAALMCYIQLSLLGCAGYVVIADTITQPLTGSVLTPNVKEYHDIWYMPCFYSDIWYYRMLGERLFSFDSPAQETKEMPAEKKLPEFQEDAGGQLTLF